MKIVLAGASLLAAAAFAGGCGSHFYGVRAGHGFHHGPRHHGGHHAGHGHGHHGHGGHHRGGRGRGRH